MLKPIYGLKGAPRAWQKELHQILERWEICQQLYAEPEFYCVHPRQPKRIRDPIGRAQAHNPDQQEESEFRSIAFGKFAPRNLRRLLSVSVDDINGTALKAMADHPLSHLNASVGQCKADYGSFLLAGIQHEHSPGCVFTHQHVCVDSIKPMYPTLHKSTDGEAVVVCLCHESCRFVLGTMAWPVFTTTELAVYVQAFQRHTHAPRVIDCKHLDLSFGT